MEAGIWGVSNAQISGIILKGAWDSWVLLEEFSASLWSLHRMHSDNCSYILCVPVADVKTSSTCGDVNLVGAKPHLKYCV